MSRASKTDRQRGFTLIEILVALAVFAIMTLIAYKGLERMTVVKQHLDQEMRFWREMTLVLDRMENDFIQLAPRTWVNADGESRPPLWSRSNDGVKLTEFVRLDERREPIHMAYRCGAQSLDLLIWPQIDVSEGQTAKEHILFKEIERCEIDFLSPKNVWVATWGTDGSSERPLGIRIRLGMKDRGEFERVIALP